MKRILFPFALLLGSLSFLPGSQAQDHARWGLPEGAVLRLGKGLTGEGDRAVAYSPDGTRLAVAGNLGVWLYDVHTGAEVALLTGHAAPVHSVAFAPDGETLASASADHTVRLWDVDAGESRSPSKAI